MVQTIKASSSREEKPKFGTFTWVDHHMKALIISLTSVGCSFNALMVLYYIHLMGYSSEDISNRYLAITTLVFAVASLLNNCIGIGGAIAESLNLLKLFMFNNVFVTVVSLLYSCIHVAKGAYFTRDKYDTTGLSSLFYATAVGYIVMSFSHAMLLYLIVRLNRNNDPKQRMMAEEIKLHDTLLLIKEDLNTTRSGTGKGSVDNV